MVRIVFGEGGGYVWSWLGNWSVWFLGSFSDIGVFVVCIGFLIFRYIGG